MSNLAATESRSSDATDLSKGADAKLEYQPGLPGIIEDSDLQGDDVDEAAAALRGQSLDYTEQEESRVVSKIDWRMMPIMAITCGLQFVDKSAVSNAATFGLQSDLHLHGQNYSWAVSNPSALAVFYFSYLGATWPSTYLLQRFHPGKVIGIACVLWGVCILAMLGVTNFGGLIACRFLLGVFEAPLSPGFMMITTRWYTQKEQPFRFGLWTLLNGWLPIPALVMFYGLGHAGGPLQPWRYIFLVLGLVTVVMGVVVFFFIADSPANAPFLNDRERAIAVERIARCQTGIKNTLWKREQFIEALTDPRVWLVVATLFLSQSGGAVTTNFIGIIIKGFGYNQLRSLLLQTPAFAIQGFICLIVTGLVSFTKTSRNLKQPLLSIAACCVIAGTGVVYSTTPTAQNRQLLLGMMYMIALNNCSFTTIMSVIGVNFAGATKKSTVSAMTFVAYCVSNIVVPQAFRGTEAPTYHTGILTVMCFQIALVICYWASWALMTLENKRRDKLQARHPHPDGEKGVDDAMQKKEDVLQGLKDLTDRENMTFRYSP